MRARGSVLPMAVLLCAAFCPRPAAAALPPQVPQQQQQRIAVRPPLTATRVLARPVRWANRSFSERLGGVSARAEVEPPREDPMQAAMQAALETPFTRQLRQMRRMYDELPADHPARQAGEWLAREQEQSMERMREARVAAQQKAARKDAEARAARQDEERRARQAVEDERAERAAAWAAAQRRQEAEEAKRPHLPSDGRLPSLAELDRYVEETDHKPAGVYRRPEGAPPVTDQALNVTAAYGVVIPSRFPQKRSATLLFEGGAVRLQVYTDTWVMEGRYPPNVGLTLERRTPRGDYVVIARSEPGYNPSRDGQRRSALATHYLDAAAAGKGVVEPSPR